MQKIKRKEQEMDKTLSQKAQLLADVLKRMVEGRNESYRKRYQLMDDMEAASRCREHRNTEKHAAKIYRQAQQYSCIYLLFY